MALLVFILEFLELLLQDVIQTVDSLRTTTGVTNKERNFVRSQHAKLRRQMRYLWDHWY